MSCGLFSEEVTNACTVPMQLLNDEYYAEAQEGAAQAFK